MVEITIHLAPRVDGSVAVSAQLNHRSWDHLATSDAVQASSRSLSGLRASFEGGHRPLQDPVTLAQIGEQLRDTFPRPFYGELKGRPARLLGRPEVVTIKA